MIKNVLQDIGGVGLYGVVSICLFFLVFSVALVWAFCLNKKTIASMSALPLEDESTSAPNSQPQPNTNRIPR